MKCKYCKKDFEKKHSKVYCCKECCYKDKKKLAKEGKLKGIFKNGKDKRRESTMFKKREKHWNWNGGKTLTENGYVLINVGNHKYVQEHRLVMEKHLGRKLKSKEVVHHLDYNKSNNNINNLYLFSSDSKHRGYHNFLRGLVARCIRNEL